MTSKEVIDRFDALLIKHIPFDILIYEERRPFLTKNSNDRNVIRIKYPESNKEWINGINKAAIELCNTNDFWVCYCNKCAVPQYLTIFLSSSIN